MLTRNYWKCAAVLLTSKSTEVCGDGNYVKPTLITASGDVGTNVYGSSRYSTVSNIASGNNLYAAMKLVRQVDVSQNLESTTVTSNPIGSYGLVFGSGNTPVTIDDCTLSGSAITNISVSYSDNSVYEEDGSASVLSFIYTITNNNDTDIVVGEVGVFAGASWPVRNYNTYGHHYYMFERTALETPITIPAGGVGQVTYTIRMNYPVA